MAMNHPAVSSPSPSVPAMAAPVRVAITLHANVFANTLSLVYVSMDAADGEGSMKLTEVGLPIKLILSRLRYLGLHLCKRWQPQISHHSG